MAYSIEMKERARAMRSSGQSLNEIISELKIAKNTLLSWTKAVGLTEEGIKRKQKHYELIANVNKQHWDQKRADRQQKIIESVDSYFEGLHLSPEWGKILCALLYWCEGAKRKESRLTFVNSDPEMLQFFLILLRKEFNLDNSKFRVLVHLHAYHDEKIEQRFWSRVLDVPLNQFSKAYQKKNTMKRIRNGYHGCVSLRYLDVKIALELQEIYKRLFLSMRV